MKRWYGISILLLAIAAVLVTVMTQRQHTSSPVPAALRVPLLTYVNGVDDAVNQCFTTLIDDVSLPNGSCATGAVLIQPPPPALLAIPAVGVYVASVRTFFTAVALHPTPAVAQEYRSTLTYARQQVLDLLH